MAHYVRVYSIEEPYKRPRKTMDMLLKMLLDAIIAKPELLTQSFSSVILLFLYMALKRDIQISHLLHKDMLRIISGLSVCPGSTLKRSETEEENCDIAVVIQ